MEPGVVNNLIRIDPDQPIYRWFRMRDIRRTLEEQTLFLRDPSVWDDPWENILISCGITYTKTKPFTQRFFDSVRKPVFVQCWSLIKESDAMWRAYSSVAKYAFTNRNMEPDNEGIQVRSTARRLLATLWSACSVDPQESCFLGQVRYMGEDELRKGIADEVRQHGLRAFQGGRGHAESVLLKRTEFTHEREVRLIYVDNGGHDSSKNSFRIQIEPNELFDEIVLDPRLQTTDVDDRKLELAHFGYRGQISRSDLYQRWLFEIAVDQLPD